MPKLSQLEYGFVVATIIGVFAIRLIDKDLVQPSEKDMEEINDFRDLYSIRRNRKKGWKSVLDYQLLTLAKEKNTSLNVTVQGGRRTIAKKGHQNLIN
jgi:hypothetical protein